MTVLLKVCLYDIILFLDNSIEMDPPIIRIGNEANQVIYPVLRGPGARMHTLKPGEYTEFALEFNCISMEKDSESIEVIFRPSFHTNYRFKITKECEGLTASDFFRKEYEDSIVFDYFAFMFITSLVMAIVILIGAVIIKIKELKGEEVNINRSMENAWTSFKNFFDSAADKMKESRFNPDHSDNQLEVDDIEEANVTQEGEFDPHAVLKTNSKKSKNRDDEDDFKKEVKIEFDRDDDDYPSHELKDINKKEADTKPSKYSTF